MLGGAWLLGVLLLAPALTQPMIGIAVVGAVAAIWLAWKSVAYPLALAAIPSLITALAGSNPLPHGAATFLVAAWVACAVMFAWMRGEETLPLRGLWSVPGAMAFLLLGLMVLRLGSSFDPGYGSTKVQLYVADNLMLMVGGAFVGSSRQGLRMFLILTFAIAAAGAILLIGQLITAGAQQQYGGRFELSAQSGAINLGRESSNGALIAIGLIVIPGRLSLRLAAIAMFPALLVSLLAAGSRGPTIAFIVGLAAFVSLTAATGRARRKLLLVVGALIIAAIVVPIIVPGSAIGRSLAAIVGASGGLSSNGRSQLWSLAYTTFGAHPLLGIGTGGFAALDPQQYPHNILLEVAVELGVIGLLAIGTMLVSVLRRLSALWQLTTGAERLDVTLLIALFASALINAFVSGAIPDNSDVWLWSGLALGMYARHYGVPRRRADRGASRSAARG